MNYFKIAPVLFPLSWNDLTEVREGKRGSVQYFYDIKMKKIECCLQDSNELDLFFNLFVLML